MIRRCCQCTSKTRNSESNSQRDADEYRRELVVNALVKLEILKAIHNRVLRYSFRLLLSMH